MRDKLGRAIKLNDIVARSIASGRSPNLDICRVTKIQDGKVYLDGSKSPLIYTSRVLVVNEVSNIEKEAQLPVKE